MKLAAHKKAIGAVSVGLLLLLTACTPINSAATVGSKSISVDKVQKTVAEILKERSKVSTAGMNLETGETLNRSQLSFYVISELLFQVGKKFKITITEQEITDQIKAVTTQVGGSANLPTAMVNAGIAPSNLREYFRSYLLSSNMSKALEIAGVDKANVSAAVQKLVAAEAKSLKVSINPRYGAWDPETAAISTAALANGSVTK